MVAEALECLGGNGYVEENGLAAALPRGAAQLDLGGLRQRQRARRAARDRPRAGSVEAFRKELALRAATAPRLDAAITPASTT